MLNLLFCLRTFTDFHSHFHAFILTKQTINNTDCGEGMHFSALVVTTFKNAMMHMHDHSHAFHFCTLSTIMSPIFLLFFFFIHYSESFRPFYPPAEPSNPDTRVNLSIALLMSFGGAFNSSGTVPGIQVALDLINNDTELLPGYKLGYQLMDSQVTTRL